MAETDLDEDDVAEALRRADREFRERQRAVESRGEDRVEAAAEAYDRATTLLERHESEATGSGQEAFEGFVTFKAELERFVQELDDDVLQADAFDAMYDVFDKRRASASDFSRAREALDPVADTVDLIERRDDARRRYRRARRRVEDRLSELRSEIRDRERMLELGEADLSAPVERLRGPIEEYDDAVTAAFEDFRDGAPARTVLEFLVETERFPLVEFRSPPEELLRYVREYDAGEESIPTLLEYSDFSRSKLEHYVEDADELKRQVTTQQTYLRRIDPDPLTVGWPPPRGEHLEFLGRELVSVVARFADDPVVARARAVRRLPRRVDYERLREAAVAEHRLGPEQRERLSSGAVERELDRLRERRDELRDLLAELPER